MVLKIKWKRGGEKMFWSRELDKWWIKIGVGLKPI